MRLFDLAAHLEAAKVARPEQIDAVLETGDPILSMSTAEASDGVVALHHRYEGRISFDRANLNLAHVLALVAAWMAEYAEQDDEFLGWSGEPTADRLDDIDLRFHFEGVVQYVEAPGYTGKDALTWRGTTYQPGPAAADRATELTQVDGKVEQ